MIGEESHEAQTELFHERGLHRWRFKFVKLNIVEPIHTGTRIRAGSCIILHTRSRELIFGGSDEGGDGVQHD